MAVQDPVVALSLTIVALALGLLGVWRLYAARVRLLEEKVREATAARQSLATVHGRTTEQFAPWMARYPFDARNFRFLGAPVDGVQFEADRVVFVEFKTGSGRLTPEQDRIRRLVEDRRVEWLEFRVEEGAAAAPPQPPEQGAPSGDYLSG